ncbi:uncharacterized protein LOC120356539 isoform X1 [Nilaparvata lugens]|uniref:uncharacterized protein LOC120356539 isoform X1 n=1 Tax=Nilaparvata lugens TaxID=108931 RepID=UPI00193CBCBA|nr:uncharacterized protein LOC120356539 isoform X1 [Nilaparvata lugens]
MESPRKKRLKSQRVLNTEEEILNVMSQLDDSDLEMSDEEELENDVVSTIQNDLGNFSDDTDADPDYSPGMLSSSDSEEDIINDQPTTSKVNSYNIDSILYINQVANLKLKIVLVKNQLACLLTILSNILYYYFQIAYKFKWMLHIQ